MTLSSLPMLMLEPVVRAALLEDLGRAGDLTTDAIVPAAMRAETALVARQPGIVAGLDAASLAFRLIDPAIEVRIERPDGSRGRYDVTVVVERMMGVPICGEPIEAAVKSEPDLRVTRVVTASEA